MPRVRRVQSIKGGDLGYRERACGDGGGVKGVG